MIALARKAGGLGKTLGRFLHQHDVDGRAIDVRQRRIVSVGRERGVPVDGITAIERRSYPFDHHTGVVRRGTGDGERGDGGRHSQEADGAGRECGAPYARRLAAKTRDKVDGEHREQAAHHRHVSLDRHERLHRGKLMHEIPEHGEHQHQADRRRARAPAGDDQKCCDETGHCQRRAESRPQAHRPVKQEMRIPAVPDDDVVRERVHDLRVQAVQENLRHQ